MKTDQNSAEVTMSEKSGAAKNETLSRGSRSTSAFKNKIVKSKTVSIRGKSERVGSKSSSDSSSSSERQLYHQS